MGLHAVDVWCACESHHAHTLVRSAGQGVTSTSRGATAGEGMGSQERDSQTESETRRPPPWLRRRSQVCGDSTLRDLGRPCTLLF